MKKLLLLCAAIPLYGIADDTISISNARITPSQEIFLPYKTDSVDMAGKAFDILAALRENASMKDHTSLTGSGRPIQKGEMLPRPQEGQASIHVLRFTLQTPSYLKAKLKVGGIKNNVAYLGNKEIVQGDLELLPGCRETVSIVCLSQATDTDSFDISVEGKDLSTIMVNPEGKHPYTMADMIQGNHYRNVSLSPSGKYLLTVYYDTKEDGSNLFKTVVTETTTQKQLIRRNEYVSLSWLPNRDILYYTRAGKNGRQLILLDPQNGAEETIGENIPEGGFSISPSGDYLVYSKSQEGSKDKDGLKLLREPDDRQPGWRTRNALYRYDLQTGRMQRLTFGSHSVWLSDISADGKSLLLSFSDMDPTHKPFSRTTLLKMDAYSGKADTLLLDTAYIAKASFSPDGKSILIQASPAAFGGIGQEVEDGQVPNGFDYRLYLYDIAERRVTPLLRNFKPSVSEASWIEGDGNIYFSATDGYDVSLFRLNPGTQEVVRFELPVSYIQDYSISRQQKKPRAVFFGQTGERAREMFTALLTSARPTVQEIGEIDFDAMYRNVAIGTCHDWAFKSTRGDSIRGFYFLPPDFDATRKYPLIVYYYGGCTPTTKSLEFHYPLQVLAGQGYVVYVVEPSGAIGFGQEFAARHVGTWGIGSADDIIEGTKAFAESHPFVDAGKIGCMGASYGGFMTQYLQTRTDIFAAAISHAGISNIASYWGGGYWGYTYGEVAQYGSYPWNAPELYVKQSPLFNADKIHTPLLLLHGTADTNVPTNESQQLFTALRILGRPVSYIQVDGENHVIVGHSKRMAWQNAIFAWFARWLKGEPQWWEALYPDDNHSGQGAGKE